MKEIIFIAAFLLLIPSLSYALVSCSSCSTDSCSCSVSDCSSGKLFVFTGGACSGVPTDKPAFSSGSVNWYPSFAGTYYVKPFCDNSSIVTGCNLVSVSGSVSTVTTTVTAPGGGVSGCRPIAHVCTPASQCCSGLDCVEGLCQASIAISTIPTSVPTTTTIVKQDCPSECCQGETDYNDKSCSDGFECVGNSCRSISTTPTPSGTGFPWSLLIPIILALILIPLFIFFFVFKRKRENWKKLYEKWRRRRSSVYQRV